MSEQERLVAWMDEAFRRQEAGEPPQQPLRITLTLTPEVMARLTRETPTPDDTTRAGPRSVPVPGPDEAGQKGAMTPPYEKSSRTFSALTRETPTQEGRMQVTELVERCRAWARRYEPRSPERVLFLAAADELEKRPTTAELTVEAIEQAIGGPLLPWQKKRFEERNAA